VHRDLKPEDIMVWREQNGNSHVKILDFGIAKTFLIDAHESANLTTPGTVLGSIQYMSPEQLSGLEVDQRADIFAIGVMLFEVLTGSLPFRGESITEKLTSILQDEVTLPYGCSRNKQLNELLQKCLAKNPNSRFNSVADLRKEIVPILGTYVGASTLVNT